MYSKLTTGRNHQHGTIDEIEEKLHKLGHIVWVGMPEDVEKLFRETNNAEEFVRILMWSNYQYLGRRYSNRYQRFVNFGNSGTHRGTNRSIIDMFLIAKHYNPQFANLRILYKALTDWYCNDCNFNCQICSTIHRRVWLHNRASRLTLSELLNSKANIGVKLITSYLNGEMARKDELGTQIIITNSKVSFIYNENKPKDLVIPDGTVSVDSRKEPSSSIFIKA